MGEKGPGLGATFPFVSHQSAADIGQIQELQQELEEAKKEKHQLQEQVGDRSRLRGQEGTAPGLALPLAVTLTDSWVAASTHPVQLRAWGTESSPSRQPGRHAHSGPSPVLSRSCPTQRGPVTRHSDQDSVPLRNGSREKGLVSTGQGRGPL